MCLVDTNAIEKVWQKGVLQDTNPSEASAAAASATSRTPASATCSARRPVLDFLRLGQVVDQQRVEIERVGQQIAANRRAAHRQRVELRRRSALHRHLDRLQVRVHQRVDAHHRAVDHCAPPFNAPSISIAITVKLLCERYKPNTTQNSAAQQHTANHANHTPQTDKSINFSLNQNNTAYLCSR